MRIKALILTGGLGTRLRPLTLYTPKPLLPIANLPFLSYLLGNLRNHGVKEVVLCTQDSLHPYKKLIKHEGVLGTTLLCSRESKPLGTAGALKNAQRHIDSSPTFIFNGDVLTNINLSEMLKFHREKKSMLTVALVPVQDPSFFGLIKTDSSGKIKQFIEKPSLPRSNHKKSYLINAGIYLFDDKIFNLIPRGKSYSAEKELFPKCLESKLPLYGFESPRSSYWLDIGTPQKYLKANRDVILKRIRIPLNGIQKIGENNKIGRGALISKDVIIGESCTIGARCELKNCVLLDRIVLEENVRIENCIIGNFVRIGRESSITQSKIIGDDSIITPYSQL